MIVPTSYIFATPAVNNNQEFQLKVSAEMRFKTFSAYFPLELSLFKLILYVSLSSFINAKANSGRNKCIQVKL
jgi:hypothetical protein